MTGKTLAEQLDKTPKTALWENSVLRFRDGHKVTFRPLVKFDDVVEIKIWSKFVNRVSLFFISPSVYGEPDPFLDKPDNYDSKGFYCYTYFPIQVYEYASNSNKIWSLKKTERNPVYTDLISHFSGCKAELTEQDLTVYRNGWGYKTRYNLSIGRREAFSQNTDEPLIGDDLIKELRRIYNVIDYRQYLKKSLKPKGIKLGVSDIE